MISLDRPIRPRPAVVERDPRPLDAAPLETEARFYGGYGWCLDVFPTVREVSRRLRDELSRTEEALEPWQREEVAVNAFLLSCALADAVDDYLAGETFDFSRAAVLPGLRAFTRGLEWLLDARRRYRARGHKGLHRWRRAWGSAQVEFLQTWLGGGQGHRAPVAAGAAQLAGLLGHSLPEALSGRRVNVPAAFRTQDLTHHDVIELVDRFVAAFPDRERPILALGLRTAGSYFAPLVCASLKLRGYRSVEGATLRPKKGLASWEAAAVARMAVRGGLAVVVDEPPNTGTTLAQTCDRLGRAGVSPENTVLLLPVHPTRRDWSESPECLPLLRTTLITLDPEEWHKHRRLEPEPVERQMREYFGARGYAEVEVRPSRDADRFNQRLQRLSEEKFHSRLKRVYEVRLGDRSGRLETRFVLAKSVGWGWLGYHAFLAAERLAEFVPPLLGLRDGVLYMEWLPKSGVATQPPDRESLVLRVASYVAARVKRLGLPTDPLPEMETHHRKGIVLLAGELSRAFGSKPAAVLKRARLGRELGRRVCPVPTLVDGKMRPLEWIQGPECLLKTDFEHHGLGKTALNVTDPAYDLAEASMHLGLSEAEEEVLIQRYREDSGDQGVQARLFPYQLLAGIYALKGTMSNLRDPRLRHRHHEFNRSYLEAEGFLTVHTARFCGRRCGRPEAPAWRSPLMVLDIDGVLDKGIFGFPSTTAAGIEALRALHAHGMSLALNSARTLDEIKEYSRAYGCVGGVAEYGSVAWDAVSDRTRILVTPESAAQLYRLAAALRRIPGVFLDDRCRYSVRAYSYEGGRTVPLPKALVDGTIADLGLDRVRVHQTYLDSSVRAREVDKGKGLLALLDLAGVEDVETIAIGDSEADLAMFSVASRSFAPRHIGPKSTARMLGCRISRRADQPGLLDSVQSILHPHGGRCPRCADSGRPAGDGLFWDLLRAADRRPLVSLVRALADPLSLQVFLR
jgi:trehalose-6-phosphatase